jgi:acid phosphatase
VLDIDETSLSNWANIKANNFGFIADGACDRLPSGPCGFRAWILQGVAPVVKPALDLFTRQRRKGWRCSSSPAAATANARRRCGISTAPASKAGRSSSPAPTTTPTRRCIAFKTEQRRKVADAGYTIIATVGDQQSDLDGGFAECGFKVPNPFYFIP